MSKLSPAAVDRFFRLYRALHLYANEHIHVLPEVRTLEDLAKRPLEDQSKVRDAVYDHPELIDRFVAENPSGLAADDLTLVKGWSRFIRGDYYVLRHLKRYSVFLSSDQPARAYGVLGLTDSVADTFPGYALPVYLHTVLLPFEGHIIWDGIVSYYNVTFGSGIRGDLNETYQRVKQREGIIEDLMAPDKSTTAARASHPRKAQPDLRPIVQGIAEASERLRPGVTPLQGRAYSLLRAAAQLAETATIDPTNLEAIGERIRALTRSYRQLATTYGREVDPGSEF